MEELQQSRLASFAAVVLMILAAIAAGIYLGYHVAIAFGPDDTNHLETTMAMIVGREVETGPEGLYGPFSGSNPLVLIHAPFYYRIAGLLAYPLFRNRFTAITAALIAGRSLAFLGLLATLFGAYGIARVDGGSRRAGWLAVWLIAASPVFGSMSVSVRPDTLAVGLQTLGYWAVLRAIRRGRAAGWGGLLLGYVAFALAFATKQHCVVSAVVGTLVLAVAAARGGVRIGMVLLAIVVAGLITVGYFGFEERITGGMMSRSAFYLPSQLRKTAPAGWDHVAVVLWNVTKMTIGPIALAVSCLLLRPRIALGNRWDGLILLAAVAEKLALIPLLLGSEGAWVNYAMPTVVYGSIWTARAADRVLDAPRLRWGSLLFVASGLILLMGDLRLVHISWSDREDAHQLIAEVLQDPIVAAAPREAIYFVAMPQFSRQFGNAALVHDEWLYASYEAIGAAEPRSQWLNHALRGEPVRVVVATSSGPSAGHALGIAGLGYVLKRQIGPYSIWERPQG